MPKYIIKKLFEGILIAIVIISVDRLFEHFENKSTSEMTAKYSDIGELVETIDFSYDPVDQFWGQSLFKRQYGNVICEGQILTSIASRVVTNFLDLEIYCRDLKSEFIPEIEVLPKPNTDYIGVYIQNYNGQLYSNTPGETFNFNKGIWEPTSADLIGLYLLQPYKDGWAKIRNNFANCKGLVVDIPLHKNLCLNESSLPSSILVWEDKIYVNNAGNFNIYEIPKHQSTREILSPNEIVEGEDWSYLIFPVNEGIAWGGSSPWLDSGPCAPIKILGEKLKIMKYEDCSLEGVREYYSAIKIDESFLIGTYPSGNILTFGDQNNLLTKHKIIDRQFTIEGAYNESQTISQSVGMIFIGLFPYGEVIYMDSKTNDLKPQKTLRFFSEPKEIKKSIYHGSPYADKLKKINDRVAAKVKKESNGSLSKYDINQKVRALGFQLATFAQRIPTSAVLDGKICFSTANFNHVEPPEEVSSQISNIDEYGKVHCMTIPNQTLLSTKTYHKYKVDIHKNGFRVYSSGDLVRTVIFKDIALWYPLITL